MHGKENEIVVLIIEDHPMYADALAQVLPNGFRAVHAANASEVRNLMQSEQIRIALLDLDLGESGSGMPLIEQLHAANIHTIISTASTDIKLIASCVRLGAVGYLPKTATPDRVRSAMLKVSAGEEWLSEEVKEMASDAAHNLPLMTEREISVLHWLVEKPIMTTAELMEKELVCDGLIRKTVSSLIKKFEVDKRNQIAASAFQRGYYVGIKIKAMPRKKHTRRLT